MTNETRQLTVADLIVLLRDVPPETMVETEGCDCVGAATGVSLDGRTVTITRDGRYVRREGEIS